MIRRALPAGTALLALMALPLPAAVGNTVASAAAGPTLGACPSVPIPPAPAPHLRATLARHEPAIVVALGSSSTRGWQSSDPAHSYPAVLQARLAALLPHAHIAVINRGVNGEDAAEELARMQADVIAVRPELVIWQVGANGALRTVDPGTYARLITAGVALLSRAGADVMLMDNQRAPRIEAAPEHAAVDQATAEVARKTEAELFDRGGLMDAWARAGAPYSRFIAVDKLHHNDLGYRCLGDAVAAAIVRGLGPTEPGGNGPGSNVSDAGTPRPAITNTTMGALYH